MQREVLPKAIAVFCVGLLNKPTSFETSRPITVPGMLWFLARFYAFLTLASIVYTVSFSRFFLLSCPAIGPYQTSVIAGLGQGAPYERGYFNVIHRCFYRLYHPPRRWIYVPYILVAEKIAQM